MLIFSSGKPSDFIVIKPSSVGSATAIVSRSMLAANAFPDNKQAIVFAETMQKAFTVSGADISAQNAAMRQMSQALASGRLQGDEYVSIRENAPLIMNAIQEEMGLTNAALKEAAANGEITADVIKRAVFNNAEEINQMFSQMPITFGAAMQMIKNTAMMFRSRNRRYAIGRQR